MLQVKAMDHLNIDVLNLDKSIKFYKELFGFKVYEKGEYNKKPYAIIGQEGGMYLAMYQNPDLDVEKNSLSHFGVHIDNFHDVFEVLRMRNVDVSSHWDYKYSKSIYIKDPSGYEIELSEKFGGDIHKDLKEE